MISAQGKHYGTPGPVDKAMQELERALDATPVTACRVVIRMEPNLSNYCAGKVRQICEGLGYDTRLLLADEPEAHQSRWVSAIQLSW